MPHPGALPPRLTREPLEQFVEKAEKASAVVSSLASARDLPSAVLDHLHREGLPKSIVAAPHALLRGLSWPDVEVAFRAARPEDRAAVTVAAYGVAETGSVVLQSGQATPTTLNFLPDQLMVVLPRARILAHPEQVWSGLRAEGASLPRAVNFVAGPSRTADVEQKMQLGAHGPRSVRIFVMEEVSDSTI